jgi:hydrogenase maturation protein HypF
VRGLVQGVGFRPAVYRLAVAEGLAGRVGNDAEGVWIEVEGDAEAVSRFCAQLPSAAPPLARVDEVRSRELPLSGEVGFQVVPSAPAAAGTAAVPPDVATCAACLAEMWNPRDRRHRYPFLNCTDCGPRFTLVREVPYDRARTTMAAFALCAACRAEYQDPGDRRFHAQPTACPACGPTLSWRRAQGGACARGEAALAAAVGALGAGEVVAVKGLGGYALAVDAANEGAVSRLRERKRRPRKAFAVMVRDLEVAERLAHLDALARALLQSPERPIVLLPARSGTLAAAVAPGLDQVGLMLPYTGLHHLLLADGPPAVVMTSGNLTDEPIAREDDEALDRLCAIADGFLLHDREIHARADDSVVRPCAGGPMMIRRARGYVPRPVRLLHRAPPLLAVGAELKNTVCLARDQEAYLSTHVGDLSHPAARAFFAEVIERLERLLGTRPVAVAHDLHPDYASTRWAQESGLPCIGVQHHHAHLASLLAEHGHQGPVLGVAFDGTGCGPAGELWGGELGVADLCGFTRLGHLRPLALPGGEAAIRQPWRLALAALLDADRDAALLSRIDPRRLRGVAQLVEKRVRAPLATSAGRWFDAAAALLGVCDEATYEAQGPMELEALAGDGLLEAPLPYALGGDGPFEVDLRPAVRALADGVAARAEVSTLASGFHATLAHAVRDGCVRMRAQTALSVVALSGGCFQNRLFTEGAVRLLEHQGFRVLLHRQVPANDGGLALGQAAVAACRLGGGADVPWIAG